MCHMPVRHNIRLRGPWRGRFDSKPPCSAHSNDDFKTSCPFPATGELPDNYYGTVTLTRKFNATPGMLESAAVWLTLSSLAVTAKISLNQTVLAVVAPSTEIELPITEKLSPSNQLEILLSLDEGEQSEYRDESQLLVGEVAIAIE